MGALMNYAERKGVSLSYDETGNAAENGGVIVVPIYDLDTGQAIAEQHIYSDGRKRFQGAFSDYIAGNFVGPETHKLFICEGWADAVVIQKLTATQVLWALNNVGVAKVAKWACKNLLARHIVIAADFDKEGIRPLLDVDGIGKATFIHPPVMGEDWWELAKRDEPLCAAILNSSKPLSLEDAAIATGLKEPACPKVVPMSLKDMLGRLVFVADGSLILDRVEPNCILAKADYRNFLLASKELVEAGDSTKKVQGFDLWMKHPDRITLSTVTFRAGADEFTQDPKGCASYNRWRPIDRPAPPAEWSSIAQPFFDHVRWLFGSEAESFLDWLAHIEQRPGELPHYGWLHVATNHGMGRNWIASVLHGVWPANVATNYNLSETLKNGFNGALSGKILAVVDEIDEGNSGKAYQHAQTLKKMVTEETRLINPKFGRQSVEWNSCRWLVFSNKLSALPLEDGDRRFWVVTTDEEPKSPEYYVDLYRLKVDPEFIASVAHALRMREIGGFNPGQRPPLSAAKKAVLARSRTEFENILMEVAEKWPVDLVTSAELKRLVGDEGWPKGPAVRHGVERAGFVKLYDVWDENEYGVRTKYQVYCIRNRDVWCTEIISRQSFRDEIARLSIEKKIESLGVFMEVIPYY
ncbi:DUF5906 domain-containing protein [Altererythrobacter litoralis]|uniref:DUF5906 domain-containing protein n=1 Tax=Altererythrobacter litoralis TaxID=3113904 RepID=A0ABU7GGA4_9SPHN|nr:DUF5906 domain-containing protein [Erythrobacteraceae bacterium 1XM1-14]